MEEEVREHIAEIDELLKEANERHYRYNREMLLVAKSISLLALAGGLVDRIEGKPIVFEPGKVVKL